MAMDEAQKKRETPISMHTIFAVVDSLTRGTAVGPITLTERIWSIDLKEVALRFSKDLKGEVPDLNRCIAVVQSTLAQRPERMTDPDLVYFWLKALASFPSIAQALRLTMVNGAQVEQTDPVLLVTTLQSYNPQFREIMTAEIKGKSKVPHSSTAGAGPSGAGTSPKGWQPARTPKRSNAPSRPTSPVGQTRVSGSNVQNSRDDPNFNPFIKLKPNRLAATGKPGWLMWVRGQTKAQKAELAASNRCYVCKGEGHRVYACPHLQREFQAKNFCYFNPK